MYLIFILLSVSTQFSTSTAWDLELSAWRNDSLNKFLDKMIYNLKYNAQGLPIDHYPLINVTEQIDNSTWINRLFYNYTLHDGTVYNVTTISRNRDSFISYQDHLLQLSVGINFKRIQINYDFDITGKYYVLSQNVIVEAVIDDLNIIFEVTMDTKSLKIFVKNLEFPDTGPIKIKLKGSIISSWIIQDILNIGTTWFEKRILNVISDSIMKIANGIFN